MSTTFSENHLGKRIRSRDNALVRSLIRQGCRTEYDHGILYLIDTFWTSRQRQGHSLHEISYRACFKPQLPEFFINRLTTESDRVFDPFMGRGTTPVQAALMRRQPVGSDQNPLCVMLTRPRLCPPTPVAIKERLSRIDLTTALVDDVKDDLTEFYHPETLVQIQSLKNYLLERDSQGSLDSVDDWIRMVAINRLTGHSPGFFSVRTMPPNQAVSIASQRKINRKSEVMPAAKNIRMIILNKTKSLLRSGIPQDFGRNESRGLLRCSAADNLSFLATASVTLVVTSPPFLNAVDYRKDNWLRCWFAGIDSPALPLSLHISVERWKIFIRDTFKALVRVVQPGGYVIFEVGEVNKGSVLLDQVVKDAIAGLPLHIHAVMINDQRFTKTSNCWGITNNQIGTNTNRILITQRA